MSPDLLMNSNKEQNNYNIYSQKYFNKMYEKNNRFIKSIDFNICDSVEKQHGEEV